MRMVQLHDLVLSLSGVKIVVSGSHGHQKKVPFSLRIEEDRSNTTRRSRSVTKAGGSRSVKRSNSLSNIVALGEGIR